MGIDHEIRKLSSPSEISKLTMTPKLAAFSKRYISLLRIYVVAGTHGDPQPANDLGSQIIAINLETLELARIHEHALEQLLNTGVAPKIRTAMIKVARRFLTEAMKPILTRNRTALNEKEALNHLSEQIVASNQRLKNETARRIEAENKLEERERHVGQLLSQSLEMQEHLRQLTRDLISAQEEERKTISRELHDEIAQTLMGINVHLANLKTEAAANTKGLKIKIAKTQRIVKKSVEIVHQFARKLRPTMLDDLGLIPALTSFIKELAKRTGIRIQFRAFPGVEQVKSATRTVIYRVVQEALTNVTQHAKAGFAKVSIEHTGKSITLEILDDGKSFQIKDVLFSKDNRRLGILGMRERVEMVGGAFLIESELGKGTRISAKIPFSEDKHS